NTNSGPGESQQLRLWQVSHPFGSEDLSSFSEAVSERAPSPYLEMHPDDAAERGHSAGNSVTIDELGVHGPLRTNDKLAKGVVAVPVLVNVIAPTSAEVTA